jgi:Ser/Thr protein kinase RdoA (MazF antagonist)
MLTDSFKFGTGIGMDERISGLKSDENRKFKMTTSGDNYSSPVQ